ncbi:MAG: type II secretion system protein [Pseudomonadota bacterium]
MKTKTSPVGKPAKQCGYTYVTALVAIALVMIAAATGAELTSSAAWREREQELLFRGQAMQRAIQRYYEAGPPGAKYYPRSLEDLLSDPRYPNRHYLRTLYFDPLGGGAWTLLRAPDGGIAGVASASASAPRKKAHFPPGLEHLAEARSYAEWEFKYVRPSIPVGTLRNSHNANGGGATAITTQ